MHLPPEEHGWTDRQMSQDMECIVAVITIALLLSLLLCCCCHCCHIVAVIVMLLLLSSLHHCSHHRRCCVVAVVIITSSLWSSLCHSRCHCCVVVIVVLLLLLLSHCHRVMSYHCHVVSHYCCVMLHCCHIIATSCHVVAVLCCVIVVSLLCCCSCCMVNTGVLDQGWVQVGHIALPGMLQPLLVSTGDEEQVECTCFLENTDRRTDASYCHCCHYHCVHLTHGGGGPRASAGGPSSVAWDATAVVVHRGGGPRGAMDRSRHQKDLGALTVCRYRSRYGNRNIQSRAQSNLCKLSPRRPTHQAFQWRS